MFTQRLAKRLVTASVVVATMIVAPPAAADVSDVRKSIRSADEALSHVETLVASNQSAKAAVRMARANALTRKADRRANRVDGAKRKARAERIVARQYDENADTAIESLVDVTAATQVEFAELVEEALRGRDRAVATLTALLDRVPEKAHTGIAKAIAAIGRSSNVQLVGIGESIATGDLAGPAVEALEGVVGHLESALARVETTLSMVIDKLPASVRVHVEGALEQVQSVMAGVIGQLNDLFANLPIGGGSFGGGLPIGGLFD